MGKKTSLGIKPKHEVANRPDIDKWVEGAPTAPEAETPAEVPTIDKFKRLTIDIPDSLHRKLKASCAERGIRMADLLRDLIEKNLRKRN
jgi:hypothetical protein